VSSGEGAHGLRTGTPEPWKWLRLRVTTGQSVVQSCGGYQGVDGRERAATLQRGSGDLPPKCRNVDIHERILPLLDFADRGYRDEYVLVSRRPEPPHHVGIWSASLAL
jgi:hypothetical protein